MRLYHYTDAKIEKIDMNKCDGWWMTDVAPWDDFDFDGEMGAQGSRYVVVCEIDYDNLEVYVGGDHESVSAFCEEESVDLIENRWDGYTDYAVANPDLVRIVEVLENKWRD